MDEKTNKEVFNIKWCDIDIEISCSIPCYTNSFRETYGYDMYHIEVNVISPKDAPLPITETGYRSIFIIEPELNKSGGAVNYVEAMLDDASQSKKWLDGKNARDQYCLF